MNQLCLHCKVVRAPELRYTQNDQTPIAQFVVEFPDQRKEQKHRLKVVAWGKLSEDAMTLSEGNVLIVEGTLGVTLVPCDGYKEKKAELTASRFHLLNSQPSTQSAPKSQTSRPTPSRGDRSISGEEPPIDDAVLDEIPF